MKGAIFDLDGTLVDSMPCYEKIWKKILKKYAINSEEIDRTIFLTKTVKEVAEIFRNTYGVSESESEFMNYVNSLLMEFYSKKIKAKSGVRQFLQSLKEHNIKTALLTASDRVIAVPCLKNNKILEYFDVLVFCSEQNASKTQETIFFYTQKLLGSKPSETFVFEDSLYAIETAKRAGFKICGLYDAWCERDQPKIKNLSDVYTENLKFLHTKLEIFH